MNSITTWLRNKKAFIAMGFIAVLCLMTLGTYGIQHFGTQFTQQKVKEQLAQSGLTGLIHYESIHFNPFTLTPSIENISIGRKSAPWLKLSRISFNHFPISYPNLDVNFWIETSSVNELSRDTGRFMRFLGLDILQGKGTFTSNIHNEQISSRFTLDIKDAGKVTLTSAVNIFDHNIEISEFRTDLLASWALGQPEAIFIIYGEALQFQSLNMIYEDAGIMDHWQPNSLSLSEQEEGRLYNTIQSKIQALGLAKAKSIEAQHLTEVLIAFVKEPTKLILSIAPPTPINLKELALSAGDDSLYRSSGMIISNDSPVSHKLSN